MKLGSLFDGSGGFPLAGSINGIEPVWASEIEPFPVRVTKTRFPQMKHLGDVTKIDGAEIEPVDIVTFGSPCQDLSVAGKQKGIHEGERSNLFFEAVRIIKEMRANDRAAGRTGKHIRPRWAVWENVPGAFSSNGGDDFRAVLQALAEVADPDVVIPRPEKWNRPGCIVGRGWSIAWRILDAQYWGVPQRRRRIYLVADFAGERAGEILFEREGVRGDFAQSGAQGQGAAADAEGGAGRSCIFGIDHAIMTGGNCTAQGPCYYKDVCPTEKSSGVHGGVYPNVARTLTAEYDGSPCIDRGQNFIATFMGGQGAKARSIAYYDDGTTPTLRATLSGSNTVPDVILASEGDGNTRGQILENISPCMKTVHANTVVYPSKTGPLMANSHPGSYTGRDAFSDMLPVIQAPMSREYIVRRLTPTECARLQGFPDWWDADVEGSDSARYKMWGNGIALPCAEFVMRRISEFEKIERMGW